MRELAHRSILYLIATQRLKPGDYINERSLSKELGIGRTPTHQALEQLTHDKLVQFIPGRGSIVRAIGPREVLDITELRSVNEELCARLAAQYATKSDVDELDDILARTQHWAAMRNVERLLLLDRSLHACLARISRNLLLQDILSNLHARSLGYWFVVPGTPMRLGQIAAEHTAIVEAIKRGDADAAGETMRRHIESSVWPSKALSRGATSLCSQQRPPSPTRRILQVPSYALAKSLDMLPHQRLRRVGIAALNRIDQSLMLVLERDVMIAPERYEPESQRLLVQTS